MRSAAAVGKGTVVTSCSTKEIAFVTVGRAKDKKDSERSMPTMRPGRSTSATRCVVRPVPHPRSKARSKDLWAKFERKERLVGAKTSATVASRAAARSVSPKAYLLVTSTLRSVMQRTVGAASLARNRAHEELSNKLVKTSTASTASGVCKTKNLQSS